MLNERLKLKGAHRMRTAMRPDEAYGMVFTWCASAAELLQMSHIRCSKLAGMLSVPPAAHVPFAGLVHAVCAPFMTRPTTVQQPPSCMNLTACLWEC